MNLSGSQDGHLTVKLALDHAPNHSNGKWQDGQVVWTAYLGADQPLPVVCYANWSNPDSRFQINHFGKVILDGDGLLEYCLWQNGLDEKSVREWESFVADLNPENGLREKLETFQFTVEPAETNQLEIGRKLLMDVLPKEAGSPTGSK